MLKVALCGRVAMLTLITFASKQLWRTRTTLVWILWSHLEQTMIVLHFMFFHFRISRSSVCKKEAAMPLTKLHDIPLIKISKVHPLLLEPYIKRSSSPCLRLFSYPYLQRFPTGKTKMNKIPLFLQILLRPLVKTKGVEVNGVFARKLVCKNALGSKNLQ